VVPARINSDRKYRREQDGKRPNAVGKPEVVLKELQGKTILIIDDEEDLLGLLKLVLEQASGQVLTTTSGHEGLRLFYSHQPDLVIVDLMMPEMDGWEVCRTIRQIADTPLIILSAMNQDDTIIRGLKSGADDFVTKPVSPQVLLARVQAHLRRLDTAPSLKKLPSYNDGYLTIDLDKRQISVDGKPVSLSATEFRLITYMLRNAGRILTIEQILDKVWGAEYRNNSDYVHVYISRLRRKLGDDPKNPRYLLTEHGIGYRFRKQDQ
jgi:DNA-binding response OmpR family regulator